MKLTEQELQNEIKRYKAQLKALENDNSYKKHEDKRQELRVFYHFKIGELNAEYYKRFELPRALIKNTKIKEEVASLNEF